MSIEFLTAIEKMITHYSEIKLKTNQIERYRLVSDKHVIQTLTILTLKARWGKIKLKCLLFN